MCAHAACGIQLPCPISKRQNTGASVRKNADELEPDRAAPNDHDRIARAHAHFMNAPKDAGQRLGHCGIEVGHMARNFEQVFPNDAAGSAHILGVGTVVDKKILAEILLAAVAVVTRPARRRICRQHAQARLPLTGHLWPDGDDFAHQLVPEHGRRRDHSRVVAALPDFQVGPVGESNAHANENLVRPDRRNVNLLDAQVFAAVEDGCGHPSGGAFELSVLRKRFVGDSRHIPSLVALPYEYLMSTLSESAVGRAARSSACWICSSGNRCVINPATGSLREKINSAADSWMSTAAL